MKTGQMLFVAVGGMLLGAGGTLAIQTGLVNYEVTLDIRPRNLATMPVSSFQTSAPDPYSGPTIPQTWESAPPAQESLSLANPPLDEQQVAEIVSLRDQIGPSVSQKLNDLTGGEKADGDSFADHLRAAAGASEPPVSEPGEFVCPLCPSSESSLARGLREAQSR